jgi:hypothetical protein
MIYKPIPILHVQVCHFKSCLFRESNACSDTNCNTPGATKALDVTNVPSLMPKYKTRHKKTKRQSKARKQHQGQNYN